MSKQKRLWKRNCFICKAWFRPKTESNVVCPTCNSKIDNGRIIFNIMKGGIIQEDGTR
jgi:hypothetical protein